jgi:glycogen operon protein
MMLQPGRPWSLGATLLSGGLNFAVWAPDATRLELCLFDAQGREELRRVDLPVCTDGVWHGFLAGADVGCVYGYRAHGPWAPEQGHRFNPAKLLLDPYATDVLGRYGGAAGADPKELARALELCVGHDLHHPVRPDPRDSAAAALKGRVGLPRLADLTRQPQRPLAETVICEVHVRALTASHPDIEPALRGSYAALAHPAMLAHYRRLGFTALSLLPVHARADEARLQRQGLSNHWGYNSIAWFAAEPRYASDLGARSAGDELREAIERLHAEGLEVLLDVVYNHSAESDEQGPTLSLRGLCNARAYRLDPSDRNRYLNWAGCGNVLNLGEPRMVQLVLDSLRHWVLSYGVDGFRFDLGPVLGRDGRGEFDRQGPFFAALRADPVLARVKLIAEPWDLGPGGYRLGGFPPGWLEWNDQYRDTLRGWWLRGSGDRGVFAHRFAASSGQFHHSGRAPGASVNFITAHDGFTLRDLVSFDQRHNEANGEHNRDGHHQNLSWNCGAEGPSSDAQVLALRLRLQRALLASLIVSQGTPMLLAGDELGHSQQGNNNAYCQDNALTRLDWASADADLTAFVALWLELRRRHPALRIANWLRGGLGDHHGGATGLPAGRIERRRTPRRPDVLWWHPDGRPLEGLDWSDRGDRAMAIQLTDPRRPEAATALLLIQPGDLPRAFRLPPGQWVAVAASHTTDGAPEPGWAPDQAASVNLPARSLILMLDKLT